MYLQSKAWEIFFLKGDLGLGGLLSLVSLVVVVSLLGLLFLLSWFLDWFGSESQNFWASEAQLNSGVVLLSNVLLNDFLLSLVLFGFEKSKLFLLEPFSVDFTSDWDLSLAGGVDINTLALIVLSQCWWLGFFRLFLFFWDLFDGSSDLFGWFFVLVSVEFVVDVTDVSSSSTLLSWSVFSSGSASSVEDVSFGNSLQWSAVSVMSDLFGIISDSDWNFSVESFSGCLGCCFGSELFQLSSFFVGWIKLTSYFFWPFGRLWYQQIDLISRRRCWRLQTG